MKDFPDFPSVIKKLKMSDCDDVVIVGGSQRKEVAVVKEKKLRLPKTVWDRINTKALVDELCREDDSKGEIADLKYGETGSFWEITSQQMKKKASLFNSLPSAKSCRARWEEFSTEIRKLSQNSAWRSGGTEIYEQLEKDTEAILSKISSVKSIKEDKIEALLEKENKDIQQQYQLTQGRIKRSQYFLFQICYHHYNEFNFDDILN